MDLRSQNGMGSAMIIMRYISELILVWGERMRLQYHLFIMNGSLVHILFCNDSRFRWHTDFECECQLFISLEQNIWFQYLFVHLIMHPSKQDRQNLLLRTELLRQQENFPMELSRWDLQLVYCHDGSKRQSKERCIPGHVNVMSKALYWHNNWMILHFGTFWEWSHRATVYCMCMWHLYASVCGSGRCCISDEWITESRHHAWCVNGRSFAC